MTRPSGRTAVADKAGMSDVAGIVKGLTKAQREVIVLAGEIMGMPFAACVMRPLVRQGFFAREERKGFQVRWALTSKGLAVRSALMKEKAR